MQTELMTTVSPNNRGLISVWPPHVAEDAPRAWTPHLRLHVFSTRLETMTQFVFLLCNNVQECVLKVDSGVFCPFLLLL